LSGKKTFSWLEMYPDEVRPHLDYPELPLTAFLDHAAAGFPKRVATVFFGRKITYTDLAAAANRLASALSSLGVVKGDRVALLLPNCPQFILSYYAVLRLGAVVVPLNPLSVERELVGQLQNVGCRVIICQDTRFDRIDTIREEAGLETCIITGLQDYMSFLPSLLFRREQRRRGKTVDIPSSGENIFRFADLMSSPNHAALPKVELNPKQDVAVLQYTGGTTGTPKAAMLTHYNLVVNTLQLREWFSGCREGEEVILGTLPLSHIFGLTVALNLAVNLAATIILLPRYEAEKALSYTQKYGVTYFPGVPAMFMAINAYPFVRQYNLSSLRACISGAAALSPEVGDLFEQITGSSLVEGYGLTEASPVTHCNLFSGKKRTGSVGVPLPDTECRIVDLETGEREMPVGMAGELVIRGPQVMKGYWGMPEETAGTLRGGWLYTGDIARLDKRGFTYIVDRKKDMIIDGGYNIYPDEIESVLLELSEIADVAVVGLPDRYRGEKIKAYIVLREGQMLSKEQIISHCKERLAAYKVPKLVEFHRDLPKTVDGKTLRRMLIEQEKNRPSF
jgi:long-chain acyl-CoA synthetase